MLKKHLIIYSALIIIILVPGVLASEAPDANLAGGIPTIAEAMASPLAIKAKVEAAIEANKVMLAQAKRQFEQDKALVDENRGSVSEEDKLKLNKLLERINELDTALILYKQTYAQAYDRFNPQN